MAMLGIEPASLVWGLIGATLGLSLAPKDASRLRSVFIFCAVVLAAALLGTAGGAYYEETHANGNAHVYRVVRNVLVMLVGCAFHPLFTAMVTNLPAVVQSTLARFGIGEKR
jgi:hypothetical protein